MKLFQKTVIIAVLSTSLTHAYWIPSISPKRILQKTAFVGSTLVASSIVAITGILLARKCGSKWAKQFDQKEQISENLIWLLQKVISPAKI